MTQTVVQVPPTEISKVKQQLEAERIELAKQRRAIQSSQNRAAAIKAGIGTAIAVGGGALGLYKLLTKAGIEREKLDLEKRKFEASQIVPYDGGRSRTKALANLDKISNSLEQRSPSTWSDVGSGILSTARTAGTLAVQTSQIAKTTVETTITVAKNLTSVGTGVVVWYAGYLYFVPSARTNMFSSPANLVGYATLRMPYNAATSFSQGVYQAGSDIYEELRRRLHDNDPELEELVWETPEGKRPRVRIGKEFQGKWGLDPLNQVNASFIPVFPNMQTTIPYTNTTIKEILKMAQQTPEPTPTFPRRSALWNRDVWDQFMGLSPEQQQEVRGKLPRGTFETLTQKFSR